MHRRKTLLPVALLTPALLGLLPTTAGASTGSPVRYATGGSAPVAGVGGGVAWYEVAYPNGYITLEPGRADEPAAPATRAAVSANVTTLRNNGPVGNRINVVFVGDGYTAKEQAAYDSAVNTIWSEMVKVEPYKTYQKMFNVYRVNVVSNVSGISDDPKKGVTRATPLGMHFWCHGIDRLLCVDDNKAQQYAALAPAHDVVFSIANTKTYGGAGGSVTTVSGGNAQSAAIAPHELAHTLGQLGDEYDTPFGAAAGDEPSSANVTAYSAAKLTQYKWKWYRWLGANSPDGGKVGVYEGASYYGKGLFRPTKDSIMRTLGRPFSLPDAELMIEGFYKRVRPVDSVTPANGSSVDAKAKLTVRPVPLVGSSMLVYWGLNGAAIAGSTGKTTMDVGTLSLKKGQWNQVTVTVRDTTSAVRDEPFRDQYMTQTMYWNIWVA
jgi:hypothetical protein